MPDKYGPSSVHRPPQSLDQWSAAFTDGSSRSVASKHSSVASKASAAARSAKLSAQSSHQSGARVYHPRGLPSPQHLRMLAAKKMQFDIVGNRLELKASRPKEKKKQRFSPRTSQSAHLLGQNKHPKDAWWGNMVKELWQPKWKC